MKPDKVCRSEISQVADTDEMAWPEMAEEDTLWLANQQSHLQRMVMRAAVAYLLLFFGLGLLISFLGLDPLANNGLMPKALLLFVGLSLLMAVINTLVEVSREGGSWITLLRGFVPARTSVQAKRQRDKNLSQVKD